MYRLFFGLIVALASTSVLAQATSPNQGLYLDPAFASQGFGIGISEADDDAAVITLTWYTYDEAGNPVWYLGTSQLIDNQSRVMMNRFTGAADGSVQTTDEVGLIDIDFVTPDRANIEFQLNSAGGQQRLQRILPVSNGDLETIQTGLWFPPATPGWGLNWLRDGESEAAIVYIYDRNGEPTWAITDVVSNGRADLLLFSGGACPTCEGGNPQFVRNGSLSREFFSASEAVTTIDLSTNEVVWQFTDSNVTTLTQTVDPLAEAIESALYGGGSDYVTGGKPAELIDATLATLLGGVASGPGGKMVDCLRISTTPERLTNPVPTVFSVDLIADGECVLANGESVSGTVTLRVDSLNVGPFGISADVEGEFGNLHRNGRLVADGDIELVIDLVNEGFLYTGSMDLELDQVLTSSGLVDGSVAVTVGGFDFAPTEVNSLFGLQFLDSYVFELTDLTLDSSTIEGTIEITNSAEGARRDREIVANLKTDRGNVDVAVIRQGQLQSIDGEQTYVVVLDSTDSDEFGNFDVIFDELVFAPQLCANYPIGGSLVVTGPGVNYRVDYDSSCSGIY